MEEKGKWPLNMTFFCRDKAKQILIRLLLIFKIIYLQLEFRYMIQQSTALPVTGLKVSQKTIFD
jgi:hypothetical protein